MANIDIPIKRLMQSNLYDWIEFLVPNCKKEWIREMDADKVPAKKESRLDKLVLIDSPEERFILNIEPQGYLDYKMPARMLRYRSDIWEYTIEAGIGTPSIKQAVVYFYSNHDNKQYSLEDTWGNEKTLEFSYKAIKVWELDKKCIIEKKLKGLYPLMPLMNREQDETDENIIENTIETIKTVKGTAMQADLVAVMSILAGEKFTSELVKKYVRRDMLMNSPIYNEWVEDERKEAAEEAAKKAAIETTKENIIDLLVGKFEFITKDIREKIDSIDDILILNELFKKSIKISTIEEFKKVLEKALNTK